MAKLNQALSIAFVSIGMAVPALAQASGHGGWVLRTDVEFGGDEVAKVYFANGETQSVKAGQGISLGVGGHYRPADSKWDFSGTVGLKYTSTRAVNTNINMNRTVFEFRADHFLQDGWWIGAGPVWHTGIRFNADGLAPNLAFDSAMGMTAKVGWKWVALSYTGITYKDEFKNSYAASNLGVSLIGRF